jgi:hypothetical protein
MNTYWGWMRGILPHIHNLCPRGGQLHPSHFTPVNYWTGSWVGPTASLDILMETKVSFPQQHISLVVQPAVYIQCTNYTIPQPLPHIFFIISHSQKLMLIIYTDRYFTWNRLGRRCLHFDVRMEKDTVPKAFCLTMIIVIYN